MEELDAQDPRRVGQYRVLGRLGEGGMGRVYLARNAGGRSVALKFIHTEMAALPGFRDRFRREVEVVRRIGGAGTVPVLDADVDDRHPWYAAEYVPGPSLQEAVDAFGPLPPGALWRLAAGLARTLEHVHRHGLVHRDLKPSNVLLSAAGPRLIDFGVVHAALDTALTVSGARIGTPVYMSPEQAYGESVTPASDIFSFGLTVAFAASGQVPHRGTLAGQLPAADPALTMLVQHCLDPDPARRPDAGQLVVQASVHDTAGDAWLPSPVASLIARRSEELLNLEAGREGGPYTDRGDAPPRTEADPDAQGTRTAGWAFHDAPTHGPGGSGPAPPPPPPPRTPPPGTAPPPPRPSAAPRTPNGPRDGGSTPVPRASDWIHKGLLGRPAVGAAWLAPVLLTSLLIALALPAFSSWLRVLVAVGLTGVMAWLSTPHSRRDAARWFHTAQAYWTVVALLCVHCFFAAGQYDDDISYTALQGRASLFQELVGATLGFLQLFLLLGSLGAVYVLPTAAGRWMRARQEGL
ncbi:serine/threonine-protein kinase [Streptomyces sp. CC210A]|uniref:serine/threonine-protein kinase n=1 Tax=Streptomyces sp. CC210A TaxID=2898184 RepID=UPI001F30948F|nr:serine/threonine-protein kinase [Streptomyces sp. CC210A]